LEKSRQVRQILDEGRLKDAIIVASGDLNEDKIEQLVQQQAPIDAFGVGTELATSWDFPALSVVYKLVETERNGRVQYKTKLSEEKVYWPGKKQVFRYLQDGQFDHDLIARATENFAEGQALLQPVMRAGRRLTPPAPIQSLQARALEQQGRLPPIYHALHNAPRYPVHKSIALERLLEQARVEHPQSSVPVLPT
jgi:nicotinate phosphoribosyltransferase